MRKLLTILAMFLVGCFSTNPIEKPQTQEELDLWIQVAENKTNTLWMYSTGSFALVCLGLAIVAFFPSRRLSGLVFIAGGAVGMACVWVFESEWFPWVAGGTVGFIILNALAFAWVKIYKANFSSDSSQQKETKYKEDDYPPLI
jgi:hypothetical protein